jgi:hypothetical protein
LAQQKKARKVGRPKLPKSETKGRIVPVSFRNDDLRAMEAAARASNQTVSEWVRNASRMILQSAERIQETRELIKQSDELPNHRTHK